MEYVFGTDKGKEILKTKGSRHSSLIVGEFYEHIVEYPDQTVTDRYRITGKYDSREDEEGNCYDWYSIDKHYRITDRFSSNIRMTEQEITGLNIADMELGQALTDAEIAIMELQDKLAE